jgi:hypothetical protein
MKLNQNAWIKLGAICLVWGEGLDLFRIIDIRAERDGVFLETLRGYGHGWESVEKCYQTRRIKKLEKDPLSGSWFEIPLEHRKEILKTLRTISPLNSTQKRVLKAAIKLLRG